MVKEEGTEEVRDRVRGGEGDYLGVVLRWRKRLALVSLSTDTPSLTKSKDATSMHPLITTPSSHPFTHPFNRLVDEAVSASVSEDGDGCDVVSIGLVFDCVMVQKG